MNDYKELIENMRNNGDCITADIIEQLYINNDLLKKECDGLALQYGKCASDYAKLQIEYGTLAKMYAKVNEELCARTKDRDDLERILSEVIKEREAALDDLEEAILGDVGECFACKHGNEVLCSNYSDGECWEWRGVRGETDVR